MNKPNRAVALKVVTHTEAAMSDDDIIPRKTVGGTGGGGGSSEDTGRRLAALERGYEKLESKIDKLTEIVQSFVLRTAEHRGEMEARLTGIETKLDTKAAKTDLMPIAEKLAHIDGRMANIPTFWQTFFLILGAIVTTVGSLAGLGVVFAKFLKP